MSEDAHEGPTVPDDVPGAVADALEDCSAAQLRSVAEYASGLAAARDAAAGPGESDDEDRDVAEAASGEADPSDEDRPDEVPPNATVTIKEINDNRYYYWQWREGDTIKSKYKSPVDPDG